MIILQFNSIQLSFTSIALNHIHKGLGASCSTSGNTKTRTSDYIYIHPERNKLKKKSTEGTTSTTLARTHLVVWVSVVDGQAVLLPEDVGLRMSKRRATVQESALPLGHLLVTWLQTEVLLQRCNNNEGAVESSLIAELSDLNVVPL